MIQMPFLEALFDEVPGHLDIRAFDPEGGPPHVEMVSTVGDAAEVMEREAKERRNVYVGIATRASTEARDKSNLLAVNALWVDMDYTSDDDEAEFDKRLVEMQKPPSMRVSSGGGEHVYWIFSEPFIFEGPAEIERFEYTLKGLASALQTDRNATDATRILRVPGTMNYPDAKKRKAGRVAAECVLLDLGDASYHIDDFSPFELRGREDKTVAQVVMPSPKLPEVVRVFLRRDTYAMDRYMRNTDGLRDASASGVDYALAARLARHAPIAQEDARAALLASRERAGEDLKRADYYDRTVKAAFGSIRKKADIRFDEDSGEWFRQTIRRALDVNEPVKAQAYVGDSQETPRYPTHLPALFDWQGGWYGVTTFAGDYGAGKSMLALAESLGACEDRPPWVVAYHNLEMADNVIKQRVQRYFGRSWDEIARRAKNFHMFRVQPGARLDHIIDWTESVIQADTERLLVVIDSINTLASFAGYGDRYTANYFAELERVILWAQEARANSEGRIGVLLVSELNKDGDAKGGKINYASDCVLSIKDLSRDQPDTVGLHLKKSRERGMKDLGEWHRDWQRTRFKQGGGSRDDRPTPEPDKGPEEEPEQTPHWFNR
jgi:hypothetical protein